MDNPNISTNITRNVQTQHGDSQTADEGNIFVIANCLWPKIPKIAPKKASESPSPDPQSTEPSSAEPPANDDVDSSSPLDETDQVVWIEPFANGTPTIEVPDEPMPVVEISDSDTTEAVKRKADAEIDAEIAAKKAKREQNARRSNRPGFDEDRYDETSYYVQNGLRKVYPYYFTFTTFTKGRWIGETILNIFGREFRAQSADVYERSIQNGTLTVNHRSVPTDYVLKHNDLLANIVHRHEVPVMNQAIQIIHMDDDIVVVNKPSSIPVHPCGRYRHNTAVYILAKDYGLKNLRTMHRLDRLTSGLLLFGRNAQKARLTEQQIRTRLVEKQYVCRVEGEFPDDAITCAEPIEVVSYKIGVCRVTPTGKECETIFEKLSYNGTTSVVLCKPKTGRMHQIRVHLQYLGYPIVNDPLYNHTVFGPLKGRGGDFGGKTDDELINDLVKIHNAESWLSADGDCEPSLEAVQSADSNDVDASGECVEEACTDTTTPTNELLTADTINQGETVRNVATQTSYEVPTNTFEPTKVTFDEHCFECKTVYRDPKPQDLIMYLHALKYAGPGWSYETPLPEWANANWIDESH